jgi:hypothetical protein
MTNRSELAAAKTCGHAPAEALAAARRDALGSFLWRDPERILAVAACLRDAGGVLECRIRGGSMGMAVPGGSRIRIRVSHEETYPVGRVVAFLVGTKVMVHRIVYRGRRGRARNHVITIGDMRWLPDAPVSERSILGAVVEVEDRGRWREPGERIRQPLLKHLLARAFVAMLAGVLEMSVRLAQRLAAGGDAVHARFVR